MTEEMLSIGRAAKLLGVTVQTLRNWDKNGQFKPDEITKGGMRRYSIRSLRSLSTKSGRRDEKICKTIAYARVISNHYKTDLKKQIDILQNFCETNSYNYEVIEDIGSSINYFKPGLTKLIKMIINDEVKRIVVTNKERLITTGGEILFTLCATKDVDIVFISSKAINHQMEQEELKSDMLDMIASLSARLAVYPTRENLEIVDNITRFVRDNAEIA